MQETGVSFHRCLWRKKGSFGSIRERSVPESITRRNCPFVHARNIAKRTIENTIHKARCGTCGACPRNPTHNWSVHGACSIYGAFVNAKLRIRIISGQKLTERYLEVAIVDKSGRASEHRWNICRPNSSLKASSHSFTPKMLGLQGATTARRFCRLGV